MSNVNHRLVIARLLWHSSGMLYLKAFHVICMVAWYAGLFYLPRLFVYHAMSTDAVSRARFCTMERKLYYGIMAPSAWLTVACGTGLLYGYAWDLYRYSPWLWLKLIFVLATVIYHLLCGRFMGEFAREESRRSHVFFRVFNEIPVLFLVATVVLVIAKPFEGWIR